MPSREELPPELMDRLPIGGPRSGKNGRVWADLVRKFGGEDRPRPGANQFGAGSPFTLQGVREVSSMSYDTGERADAPANVSRRFGGSP